MHAAPAKRSKKLTGLVAIRLLPDEVLSIDTAATEAGLSKSEWMRRALLTALRGSTDTQLLLAEVLVSRSVVLCDSGKPA